MRIPLVQPKKRPQARLRHRSTRGRKATFREAIPVKVGVPRRRGRAQPSTPARRPSWPSPQERVSPEAGRSAVWLPFRQAVAARWWVLVALLLLLSGAAYATSDERFFVYGAAITGAEHLDAQAIYSATGVDKQSIFWIDPQQVAEKVYAMPGIKSVDVSCALPSEVAIRVEERQPAILWRSESQHRDWWLDAEGFVLPYHGDPLASDTVFVVDYGERSLVPGELIEPASLASSVLQMAASLTGVRVFFLDAGRGIYYTQQEQAGEWPVYVGDSSDLAHKLQVADLLNKHFADNKIKPTYVDVRWASRPVYGLPGGGN